jgi:hypothetical protein
MEDQLIKWLYVFCKGHKTDKDPTRDNQKDKGFEPYPKRKKIIPRDTEQFAKSV